MAVEELGGAEDGTEQDCEIVQAHRLGAEGAVRAPAIEGLLQRCGQARVRYTGQQDAVGLGVLGEQRRSPVAGEVLTQLGGSGLEGDIAGGVVEEGCLR
ncbi:hypothetical protein GCM10012285_36780 [Streptomyces kronopolitis]|uniref:Uncharacterized protein n=1 Tax=Streptomyces kronopolitis TaxID=1612435 RepID=A0ABQ2JMX5_9ACTN|nr:hypothetical protein GCM10012285_36780 [Streptomyces kronopolitis]